MPKDDSKQYDTDPAKAKARELQEDFYTKHLPKPAASSTVWYFPGPNNMEGPIFDRLNIPRQNRFAFEREASIAAKLRYENPDLNVVEMPIEDYLRNCVRENTKIRVDLASLDYTQQLGETEISFLADLRKANSLDSYILHVAALAKRDSNKHKDIMAHGGYYHAVQHANAHEQIFGLLTSIGEAVHKTKHDLKKIRSDYFTGVVFSTQDGVTQEDATAYVQSLPAEVFKPFRLPQEPTEFVKKMGAFNIILEMVGLHLETLLNQRGLYSQSNSKALFNFLSQTHLSQFSHSYLPAALSRYKYTSESRAPMIGDLALYEHPEMLFAQGARLYSDIIRAGVPVQVIAKRLTHYEKISSTYFEENKLRTGMVEHFPERIDLGSGATKPRLTLPTARKLAQERISWNELEETYTIPHTVTKGRYAAFLAHQTMGTHLEEKKNFSRTDREAIVDLLISANESEAEVAQIQEAFEIPNSQFRAFKAIATRRKD
jgi:hypothetical protein